jgi:hypothetical protein
MISHTEMAAHDGYAPHSHEVRPDHLGVGITEITPVTASVVVDGNVARHMRSHISTIINLVADMTEIENQDIDLVLEMSQAMLTDLYDVGRLKPLREYIRRYCDVADSKEDLDDIIRNLTGEEN